MSAQNEGTAAGGSRGGSQIHFLSRAGQDDIHTQELAQDFFVFRRGRHVGTVRTLQCDQFEAVQADGESLGRFNSSFAAARALLNIAPVR